SAPRESVAPPPFRSEGGEVMTPEQRNLARHALGLPNKRRMSYRNHFVTGPGCSDYDRWMGMVERGHAKRRDASPLSGGDPVFWLTGSGAKLALARGERLDPEDFPEINDAA